jgi:ketosteroid isomerase-like protein
MVGAGGGVEKNTVSDVQVMVVPGGNTAIVSSFIENRSRSPKGDINEEKGFESEIWQKIDGVWKVISLHYSVIPPE